MKTADIYVKGLRDPFRVSEEEGKRIQEVQNDASVKKTDLLKVGLIWSGTKGDLRFVKFNEHTFSDSKNSQVNYSPEQLKDFEKELEPFKVKEDDEECSAWVGKYMRMIQGKELPKVTEFTKKMIEAARERLDKAHNDFPGFPEWLETKRDKQSPEEDEEKFVSRMGELFVYERRQRLQEILEEKEQEVRLEAVKIAKARIVGSFTSTSEKNYLLSKQAIRFDERGNMVITVVSGMVLYTDLANKLSAYKRAKDAEQGLGDSKALQYEEMASQLANDMSMDYA